MAAHFQTIKYEVDEEKGVAQVTLSRPERMNAYTTEMAQELVTVFDQINQNDKVKAVVLTGDPAGRAFCAGADLSPNGMQELAELEQAARQQMGMRAVQVWRDPGGMASLAILRCRKAVIAAINGSAVGIGLTLPLAADLRIVAADTKVGFVFARRGLVTEACSSLLLQRIVPRGKALEWVLTGKTFLAREAEGSGLFNEIVAEPSLVLPRALALAQELAAHCCPRSVALCKALMLSGLSNTLEQAHLQESRLLHEVFLSPDFQEGVLSFFEKRPPRFTASPWTDLPETFPWDGATPGLSPFRTPPTLQSSL